MRRRHWTVAGCVLGAATLALIASAAAEPVAAPPAAAPPAGVADLVGLKGRDGESELLSRGYVFHHGAEAKDGKLTAWWNAGAKACLEVLTRDGRYAAIKSLPEADCEGPPR
jgi:hypothetical protein